MWKKFLVCCIAFWKILYVDQVHADITPLHETLVINSISNVQLQIQEVEVFSISGRKLKLVNPSQNTIYGGQLRTAEKAIDGINLPCTANYADVQVNRSGAKWSVVVEYFPFDPIAIVNIYPRGEFCNEPIEYGSTVENTLRIELNAFQDNKVIYQVSGNPSKGQGYLKEPISIQVKATVPPTKHWKIALTTNNAQHALISVSEIQAFRRDGTQIPIESQFWSPDYNPDDDVMNNGKYRTATNCDAKENTFNYWQGTILNNPKDRITKIVIHPRVQECSTDGAWKAQRFTVLLNGVIVYSIQEETQIQNEITLLLEPLEIFKPGFGHQMQFRGLVPIFNSRSGLDVEPVVVYPRQTGELAPFVAAHAVDGRNQGDCWDPKSGEVDLNTPISTCVLTSPDQSFTEFKAILISEVNHQVSGFEILDNISQDENAPRVKGCNVAFRNKVELLEEYDHDNAFMVTAATPSCKCLEDSLWFICPIEEETDENKYCTLTNDRAPLRIGQQQSVCGSGPISDVVTAYIHTLTTTFSLMQKSVKGSQEYLQHVVKVADIVNCIQLPLREALSQQVVIQLVEGAFKALEVIESFLSSTPQLRKSLEQQVDNGIHEPILFTFANHLHSEVMRIAYPEPLLSGTKRIPLYSMERILSLPNALGSWQFSEESRWTQRLRDLSEEMQVPNPESEFCEALFTGLASDVQVESEVSTANENELKDAIQAVNERVQFSQGGLLATTIATNAAAKELDDAVVNMKKLIEKYRQAKLKSDIINAALDMVVALGAYVATAAATVASGGLAAGALVTASLFLASAAGPIRDLLEAEVKVIQASQSLSEEDERDLKLLTDAGYEIDAEAFSLENQNFNSNVKQLSKELLLLAKELMAFMVKAGENPDNIVNSKVREAKMNPLVWDSILLQMKSQLEAMSICVPPDITELRRLQNVTSTDSLENQRMVQRRTRNMRGDSNVSQGSESFQRALLDKAQEERVAAKESIANMQQKCNLFMLNFEQVTNYGKMVHMDLIELSSLVRGYRLASFTTRMHDQNIQAWKENFNTCDSLAQDVGTYKVMLATQYALAKAMEAQDVANARNRLVMVCETIDYVLNPAVPVCNVQSVYSLTSIEAINHKYQKLKETYERKWMSQISAKSESFHSLDITHLLDLELIRKISGVSNHTDFEFNLTPDDIPENHILKCHSNVEIEEVAIVFGGVDENGAGSYSTNLVMSGQFLKEQAPSQANSEVQISAFLPHKAYTMSFQYELNKDNTCRSSEADLTKICNRQVCRVSSGGTQDLASGVVARPTLYASYRVQVTQLGRLGLESVNSVSYPVQRSLD